MNGDEVLHPGHRSIRLKGRDYSSPGLYFVTICAHDKQCVFGRIVGGQVQLSSLGQTAHECWVGIPLHFAWINLHGFVIMPNHVNDIFEIASQAGAQHAAPLQVQVSVERVGPSVKPGSLSAVVRSFKAAVTKRARSELKWAGEIWQRNYFERVIRDGQEFSDASRYIAENPMKWEWDRENLKSKRDPTAEVVGAQHAAPLQRKTVPWN